MRTGEQQADEGPRGRSQFTKFIRYFLLAFAGIALFVGAFVIFNTLSITVAQRTREFATLRTIGASRRQLLTSVIIEAFVIGLIASVIGLFVGLGLAVGLNKLFEALDLDLPDAPARSSPPARSIVSMIIGIGVTRARRALPGHPRHAGAADRGRPRGRRAAQVADRPRSRRTSRS